MVAGWDAKGPSLYLVGDEGTKTKGNVFSVGSGSPYAYGVLDTNYKYDLTLEEAIELGRRAIFHAGHRDAMSGGCVRVYHIHENGWTRYIAGEDINSVYADFISEKGIPGYGPEKIEL